MSWGGSRYPCNEAGLPDTPFLIPAFSAVEEELKHMIRTDGWHLMGLILISGAGVLSSLLFFWKMKHLGKRISLNKEQV